MRRRHFLRLLGLGGASLLGARAMKGESAREVPADLVVVGGGLGGVAAALAALRAGRRGA